MIPPYLLRTPLPAPTPPPSEGERLRRAVEEAQVYRLLNMRAAVDAWQLTRPAPRPLQASLTTRRDGQLRQVARQHYETALHSAQAARLQAEAKVGARKTYLRPGPTPLERTMREAAVRDPFAAAWGADPLNREIALQVATLGTGRLLAPTLSRLTWAAAGRGATEFALRAGQDGTVQYLGGLAAHDGDFGAAYDEVNLTSMFMAGLPGDGMLHSVRNNLISNSLEWKLSRQTGTSFEPMTFDQPGVVNFSQKFALGVGTDYVSGRLAASVQPLRGNAASVVARSKDPHVVWLYRQRLRYLNAFVHGTEGLKVMGEATSNVAEDQLKQVYEADQQP